VAVATAEALLAAVVAIAALAAAGTNREPHCLRPSPLTLFHPGVLLPPPPPHPTPPHPPSLLPPQAGMAAREKAFQAALADMLDWINQGEGAEGAGGSRGRRGEWEEGGGGHGQGGGGTGRAGLGRRALEQQEGEGEGARVVGVRMAVAGGISNMSISSSGSRQGPRFCQ
jgi:hypothetical protein